MTGRTDGGGFSEDCCSQLWTQGLNDAKAPRLVCSLRENPGQAEATGMTLQHRKKEMLFLVTVATGGYLRNFHLAIWMKF
jgi:hypothetical protein